MQLIIHSILPPTRDTYYLLCCDRDHSVTIHSYPHRSYNYCCDNCLNCFRFHNYLNYNFHSRTHFSRHISSLTLSCVRINLRQPICLHFSLLWMFKLGSEYHSNRDSPILFFFCRKFTSSPDLHNEMILENMFKFSHLFIILLSELYRNHLSHIFQVKEKKECSEAWDPYVWIWSYEALLHNALYRFHMYF